MEAETAGAPPGVWSEADRLQAVVMHRPGVELQRLGPEVADRMQLAAPVSLSRAQDEHDALVAQLRSHGIDVLLVGELLEETLDHSPPSRFHGISRAVTEARLGPELAPELAAALRVLPAAELARILIVGMTVEEAPLTPRPDSLLGRMSRPSDFVIDPLPDLMFTRDSSFWVGPKFAIARLAAPERAREALITDLIYAYHPSFRGARRTFESRQAPAEGGDVLLLSQGVVAIGVGERTSPTGAEALARSLFADELAETVLVVPTGQRDAAGHLDIVVGMVATDAVMLDPAFGDLIAYPLRARDDGRLAAGKAAPFAEAAAEAMGIERMRVIESPVGRGYSGGVRTGGQRSLPLEPGAVLSFDTTAETVSVLRREGIEVIAAQGASLDSKRGGPGVLARPVARGPAWQAGSP